MTTQYIPPRQAQRRLPPGSRKPNKKKIVSPLIITVGAFALGTATVLAMVVFVLMMYLSVDRIPAGVQIAGIDVGGETFEDAQAALQQSFPNSSVTATDNDRSWSITLADLGISLNVEATLAAAQDSGANASVQPVYAVDLNQAQAGLVYLSELANIEPVPGRNGRQGRAIDIPVALDWLRVDPTGQLLDGVLELPMIEIEPPEDLTSENYTGETTAHVVERGQELGLIAQMYDVSMQDIISLNNISDPDLLYIGQELTIPAAGIYQPTTETAPPAPRDRGKSILVSVSDQRIYAYDNGELVRSHITSTGLPDTPTVLGDYSIYVKYVADDMSGPDYFLPQVPWTMYFYQGYAIHGTYWHNSFGRPMSHGCVNLPVDEAQWFFNFAEVGTPVRVIA
jgi:lipoprotein-anchoring transpeptidase ErfK/SrfK